MTLESGAEHLFAVVTSNVAAQHAIVTEVSKLNTVEAQEYWLMTQGMYKGESPVFLARIKKVIDDQILTPDNVDAIKYTASRVSSDIYGGNIVYTPVRGHTNVSVPTSAVLSSLTTSNLWNVDETGYNFIHSPDCTDDEIFPAPGKYRVVYTIWPSNGNSIPLTFDVEVN